MTNDPRDDEFLRQLSDALPGLPTDAEDLTRIRSGIRRRRAVRWTGVAVLATAGIVSSALIATRGSNDRQTILPPAAQTSAGGPPSSISSSNDATSPLCSSAQLSITIGEASAGLGHNSIPIHFTNVSGETCTLSGYPGVDVIDATGARMSATRTRSGYLGGLSGNSTSLPLLTLGAGQVGTAIVEALNHPQYDSDPQCRSYVRLTVTPPNLTQSVDIPLVSVTPGFVPCAALEVHPLLPGTSGRVAQADPPALAALSALATSKGSDVLTSPTTAAAGNPLAFIAFDNSGSAVVDVLSWNGLSWSMVAELKHELDPILPTAQGGLIRVGRITDSPENDAVVYLRGGTAYGDTAGIVISKAGGQWRLVPFQNGGLDGNDTYEIGSPEVSGSTITSRVFDSCGQGCAKPAVQTRWAYSPAVGKFVASPN